MKLNHCYQGDCRDVMDGMEADSIDAIVCDPPYGLKFMGKGWDHGVPGPEYWIKALRVAKPGAHLLAFGGTRMFHRLMVAIEDAGWEIRDTIMWVYSSGFPKSKNLDNLRGEVFCDCETQSKAECGVRQMRAADVSAQVDAEQEQREILQPGLQEQGSPTQGWLEFPSAEIWAEQSSMEGRGHASEQERELRSGAIRPSAGMGAANGAQGRVCDGASAGDGGMVRPSADTHGDRSPSQPQAARERENESGIMAGQSEPQTSGAWPICGGCGKPRIPRGLGTALKPAWEPIVVARKPLAGTVAENVLAHGVGALNIDGGRVQTKDSLGGGDQSVNIKKKGEGWDRPWMHDESAKAAHAERVNANVVKAEALGRWPANLIHDGSDEVVSLFPSEAGAAAPVTVRNGDKFRNTFGAFGGDIDEAGSTFRGDTGTAARFFYCAKASRADRNEGLEGRDKKPLNWSSGTQNPGSFQAEGTDRTSENHHPTVKPTELMRYLCRLVTPPKGLILDPFAGSGSTGKAAVLEGFRFVGIELEAEHVEIARARIEAATPRQAGLEFAA